MKNSKEKELEKAVIEKYGNALFAGDTLINLIESGFVFGYISNIDNFTVGYISENEGSGDFGKFILTCRVENGKKEGKKEITFKN